MKAPLFNLKSLLTSKHPYLRDLSKFILNLLDNNPDFNLAKFKLNPVEHTSYNWIYLELSYLKDDQYLLRLEILHHKFQGQNKASAVSVLRSSKELKRESCLTESVKDLQNSLNLSIQFIIADSAFGK